MTLGNFGFESIETYLQKGIYFIPDYQREYAWERDEQLYDFWLDLDKVVSDNRPNHFYGQVVIHENRDENKKYIIDGQQRTATSVILLAVLRDLFDEIHNNENISGAQNKYEDIRLKFIGRWDPDPNENELRLTLGKIDKDFFRNNIQINRPTPQQKISEASHKRIKEAYSYLENKLREKINLMTSWKDKYNILLQYYNAFIKKFRLMYVETDELNEAFVIFETLNARGKALETSDLLKNHLFMIAGPRIERVKDDWTRTVDNLENIDVTKFLRHYWNSKEDFVREKDLFKNIREKINTPKKSEEFTRDFLEMSDVYKALVNPDDFSFSSDQDIIKRLKNLKVLKASSFYPVILALVSNPFNDTEGTGYKETDIKIVLDRIETLVVRNFLIAGKVANKYEIIFANLAKSISEKEIVQVEQICERIEKETLSDEDFESAFSTFTMKSVTLTKFLLRELNNSIDPEVNVILDNTKIHVEHIMPISLGDWKIDPEVHEKYLNRLGNITLLGSEYNKIIKNSTFDKKKKYYEKSSIVITKKLCENNEWDSGEIEKRQGYLYSLAKERWNLKK